VRRYQLVMADGSSTTYESKTVALAALSDAPRGSRPPLAGAPPRVG
jgi:hypothetical protein